MTAKLIGTGGYAQAGKDAVIDLLEPEGFVKTYMSKALEEALLRLNPWVDIRWNNWEVKKDTNTWPREKLMWKGDFLHYRELHALLGYEQTKNNLDVRVYLQKLGTEVGRDMCDKEVWIRWAFREVDEALEAGTSIGITGMRYHNELEHLHKRGGLSIWVNRPGYGPVNEHTSDNTLGPDDFDVVIENDGTLEDLRDKILYVVSQYDHYHRFDQVAA